MNNTFTKKHISLSGTTNLKKMLRARELHTVCESALCPNIGECFAKKTATFLICGDTCTRACAFCGVSKGISAPLDAGEPERVAAAVRELGLKYAVITSVTRDDLQDGGAGHFARTVNVIRKENPGVKLETLVPDFKGDKRALSIVFAAGPDVFSHNIETVPSIYAKARQGADYSVSLGVLKFAARNKMTVKSGIMLGLGETDDEVISTMKDISNAGCEILTIGQYLQPTNAHLPASRHLREEEFGKWKETALELGFKHCASGTYVRSSYLAETMI